MAARQRAQRRAYSEDPKICFTRLDREVAMNSRGLTKRIVGSLPTCLLALLLVPAPVGAQNNESKQARRPAINNNRQSAPRKAAPARPAQQAPVRPAQRTPGTARGGVTTGTRPNNAGTEGRGGITGTRSNSNAGTLRGGGITGNSRTVPRSPVYIPGRNVQTTTNADGTKRHYNPKPSNGDSHR